MITDKTILEALKDFPLEKQEYFIMLLSKQEVQSRVIEAKEYLASTDYKVLPDYDKPDAAIVVKRQEAREFIRANEDA